MSDWVGIGTPIVPIPGGSADSSMINDLDMTALPLDDFRRIMGIDPWHFWQMSTPDGCSNVYTHYRWIGDGGPGRSDYVHAILMAERQMAQKLEYWPGLRYEQNEVVRMVVPRQPVLYNRTPMKLEVRWHNVSNVGLRTWTVLSSSYGPAYGASEDVVMTVAVPAGTVTSEVVVCYPGTHVLIRPISVSISGLVATITVKKWLMGEPSLWVVDDVIDPDDSDNLLVSVDIYRLTYDPTQAILLAWEPEIQWCGCLQEDCAACSHATHLACALRGDYKHGLISWQAGAYDAATATWASHVFPSTRYPDLAYVNYLHGAPTDTNRYMSPYWQQHVSHFAAALMEDAGCGCSNVVNGLRYWLEDMGLVKDTSHQLGPTYIDNPFGTRRGQLAAWHAVLMHVGD